MTTKNKNLGKDLNKSKTASNTVAKNPTNVGIDRPALEAMFHALTSDPTNSGVKFVYIPDLMGQVVVTYALLRLPAAKGARKDDHRWLAAVARCSENDTPCKEGGKAVALGRLHKRVEKLLSIKKHTTGAIKLLDVPQELRKYIYDRDQHIQIYNRRNRRISKVDWIRSKISDLKKMVAPKIYNRLLRFLNKAIFSTQT